MIMKATRVSSGDEARSLTILFGLNYQRVKFKFYPTGSREDLLAGIREVIGAEPDAKLRFTDSTGDIIVLSPSGIPNGAVFHVSVYKGPPQTERFFQNTHSHPTIALPPCPPSPSNSEATPPKTPPNVPPSSSHVRFPAGTSSSSDTVPFSSTASSAAEWRRWAYSEGVDVSNVGTKFRAAFQASGDEAWAVYTPPIPTRGKHYFVIWLPPPRPCCASIGVIPKALCGLLPRHRCIIGDAAYPHMVSLMSLGVKGGARYSDLSAMYPPQSIDLGVYFDMDRRMVVMVPHEDPMNEELAVRFDNVPVPLCFALCSPKHALQGMIRLSAIPSTGVFAGEKACFIKSKHLVGWQNFCLQR
ncbi:hypothetical protein CEUSTIGMA_g6274.t1 [Chlamydomonas eustigma]|uniref:Uncharacterized protein n=1 Tax=Chlamydomonas eustigma TaxID=1157962 RepID=A0A250X6Y6_9CHLO|nr:hypothetical protein CEUSTIGMA_g6274.t1 [Chlamydomonas eustigma]|eukprot:GAX78837.1 hypothetical protein CEUSTIGMA_g6274.t1 [Chlamydomonas eustigma]